MDVVASLLDAERKRKREKRARQADEEDAEDVAGEDDELDMTTKLKKKKKKKKYKRAEEDEDEEEDDEDGPVRESLVGVAAAKRAAARKAGTADMIRRSSAKGKEPAGSSFVHNGERDEYAEVHDAFPREEDEAGGVRITPFNLEEERREGTFDEAGHFVSNKRAAARRRRERRDAGGGGDDDDDDDDEDNDGGGDGDGKGEEADRWLEGVEVADIAKIRERRIKEMEARQRQREQENGDAIPAQLNESSRARLKAEMMRVMMRGETVGAAIRRLGNATNKSGASVRGTADAVKVNNGESSRKNAPDSDTKGLPSFDRLVSIANALMDDGELDTYTLSREDLERGAALFGTGIGNAVAAGTSSAPRGDNNDAEDDMFADEDEDEKDGNVKDGTANVASRGNDANGSGGMGMAPSTMVGMPVTAKPAGTTTGASARCDDAGAKVSTSTAFDSWPVSELRRFLRERPHPRGFPTTINDKAELIAAASAAAAVEHRCNLVSLIGFRIREDDDDEQQKHQQHQQHQQQTTTTTKRTAPLYVNERLSMYYYPDEDMFYRSAEAPAPSEWLRRVTTTTTSPSAAASIDDDATTMYGGDAGTYFHLSSGKLFAPESQCWM